MAKGKAKFNSSGAGPPQPRSLGLRKRECPSDEMSLTLDVGAVLHQQDTERNNAAVVIAPPQCLLSPVQECAPVTNQLDQTEEQSYLTKPDDSSEETHAENVVQASEGQEDNSTITINNDTQLQAFIINPENDTKKDGKEEINPQEASRSPSQTYTDQVITSDEYDRSCAATLEEQLDAKKNSQCNLEINHKTSQEEPSNMCMAEVREVTKESTVGLPARKKRRMGMCGLTEKERCHFLQTQKCENGQNGAERIEKQLHNNTADLVAQEQIISPAPSRSSPLSITVEGVTVQGKGEIELQSSYCGGDNSIINTHRAETEVCVTVTRSDGTSASCYPGCSEGKSSEDEGDAALEQEQTDEANSNQPTDLKQQELEGSTGEISVKQRKGGDDGSAGGECSPAITFYTNPPHQNEGTEKKKDGSEAVPLQVQSVTRTRDEIMSDTGAEAAAASIDSGTGGISCDCVELCDAAVTPINSERKDSVNGVTQGRDQLCKTPYVPDVEPAACSTVNAEQTQTRDITELLGCGYLDNVSDSQLNSIALIEEEMMTREEDPGFTYCHEDATNLICGLIRELSSLNQKVMATHRELENLRRGSKTSRSSIR